MVKLYLCGVNDVRICGKKFLKCLEVPSVPPTPPCAADCGLRSIWHGCMAQWVLWSLEQRRDGRYCRC